MKEKRNIAMSTEANRLSFGERGLRILDNSSTFMPSELFGILNIIEDCTFTADCNSVFGDESVSLTLSAGNIIYGNFNNINITSGKMIAYIK